MFQIQQQSVQVGAYREWDKRPLSIILQEKLLADGNAKKEKKIVLLLILYILVIINEEIFILNVAFKVMVMYSVHLSTILDF